MVKNFNTRNVSKRKEELKEKIGKLLMVFAHANEQYHYVEYFHNPATKEERDIMIEGPMAPDFEIIKHMLFRSFIIEIAKLYSSSDSHKYRLGKLVDSLAPDGHYASVAISKTHLAEWKQLLDDNKDIIDKITVLRNKEYAHTDDPDKNNTYIGDITFPQIKKLLDIAGAILMYLYDEVLESTLLLEPVIFDHERFLILKMAAKGEKQRRKEIMDAFREATRKT